MIILGPGTDRGNGQGDDDIADGNGGRDRLSGGRGQDFLRGFGGADVLIGGRNRDCLSAVDGVGGNDRANGGPGTTSTTLIQAIRSNRPSRPAPAPGTRLPTPLSHSPM